MVAMKLQKKKKRMEFDDGATSKEFPRMRGGE